MSFLACVVLVAPFLVASSASATGLCSEAAQTLPNGDGRVTKSCTVTTYKGGVCVGYSSDYVTNESTGNSTGKESCKTFIQP